MRLNTLEGQGKIDRDYASLNLSIERQTEQEIKLLRERFAALKEKAKGISGNYLWANVVGDL